MILFTESSEAGKTKTALGIHGEVVKPQGKAQSQRTENPGLLFWGGGSQDRDYSHGASKKRSISEDWW